MQIFFIVVFLMLPQLCAAYNTDWFNYYQVSPLEIGVPPSLEVQPNYGDDYAHIIERLHFDLSELHDIDNQKDIYIFADTIYVPSDFAMTLDNRNLFIIARSIKGDGNVNLIMKTQNNAESLLTLMVTDLSIMVSVYRDSISSDNLKYAFGHLQTDFAIRFATLANSLFFAPVPDDYSIYLETQQNAFVNLIHKQFDLATTLFDVDKKLSANLNTWVINILKKSPYSRGKNESLERLFMQTLSFDSFVARAVGSENYVPYLDKQLYEETYYRYLESMAGFHDSYQTYLGLEYDVDKRKDAANLLLQSLKDKVEVERTLIKNQEHYIGTLETSLILANRAISRQQVSIKIAEKQFENGIEQYLEELRQQKKLGFMEAVAGFAFSVTLAYQGNVTELRKIYFDLKEGSEESSALESSISIVSDLIEKVNLITQSLSSLTTKINNSTEATALMDEVQEMQGLILDLDEVNIQWQLLALEIKVQLDYAVDLGIPGANAYLLEIEKLITQGLSVNTAQINLIREQSQLVSATLNASVNINQIDRIENGIIDLNTDDEMFSALKSEFYRALQQSKRFVYIALKKYQAAFKYWALKPSSVQADINQNYYQLRQKFADMQLEYTAVLEDFFPAPQDFYINNVVVNDTNVINQFIQTGELLVTFNQQSTPFDLFERVRLSTVRVYLEGTNLIGGEYAFDIITNGMYEDRKDQQTFSFQSNSLYRLFSYREYSDGNISVNTDGNISDRYEFAYFEPTPFTSWRFSLRGHEEYSLANVTSIRLEFEGNGIPLL